MFILWALSFLPLSAQQGGALPADKAREVMQKLTRTASEIKSMQCSFVQTKTSALLVEDAVSKGKMAFPVLSVPVLGFVFKNSLYSGVFAMVGGLIIVPIVSLFTRKPDAAAVNEMFGSFEEKVEVPKKEALPD